MNTKHEKTFTLEETSADVSARLNHWAQKAGFVCCRETPKNWLFRRGSQLQALVTFDIRKIPTEVEVTIASEIPLTVQCQWHVASPLTISTPGDEARISEQFDLLIAYLKGAL